MSKSEQVKGDRPSSDQVPIKYRNNIEEIGIILQIIEDEMDMKSIMDRLNLKHKHYFRKNYLHPALGAEVVEMTIPDKPQSSKQKYRLTDKGKALKQELTKNEH